MYPACQRFLTVAQLALNQQAGVVSSEAFELTAQGLHELRAADRFQRYWQLTFQPLVLALEPAGLERTFDRE